MLSPHRIPPNNTNKRRQKISNTNLGDNSHRERYVERPRLTSFDLKITQKTLGESSHEIKAVKS